MFGFAGIKRVLWCAALVALAVATAFLMFVHVRLMGATPFVFEPNNPNLVKTAGTDASKFYADNKYFVYAPTALNLIASLLLVSMVYV